MFRVGNPTEREFEHLSLKRFEKCLIMAIIAGFDLQESRADD